MPPDGRAVVVGGVVSVVCCVVADAPVDCELVFPAVSYACTVYVYAVFGVRFEFV